MIPRISMSVLLPAIALLFTGIALAIHPQEHGAVTTTDPFPPGTFGHDVAFFEQHHVGTIVLEDGSTGARILLVPAYQGRVMTSTARGLQGPSYGWINYALIRSGRTVEHMNPYGGEERLWLGPEGGPFSIFFKPGDPQEFAHWQVPAILDTRPFTVVSQDRRQATFTADMDLTNASGQTLHAGVRRTVRLLSQTELQRALGVAPDTSVRWVAYESENVLSNRGKAAWTKSTGMLSIWMLSMLNPSPAAVVAIPYREAPGPVVTDDYFGKVPADRLKTADGMIFFKTDGKKRSKIGVSPARAKEFAASYDPKNRHLTVLWCTPPDPAAPYVNSKWGPQTDPFSGDAINSYNDGPLDDGTQMGPFYELETSSLAAALRPGASLRHVQRMFHFEGNEEELSKITKATIGIGVRQIADTFK
jgi:hypothetical protein